MRKKALIVANGFQQKKALIKKLNKLGFDFVVAADGGANNLMKINVIPDVVIGDFDSIESSTLNWAKKKSKLIQINRQNDTDVEKAIKYLIKEKFTEAIILGGTGDRLDHSIANIGFIIKYSNRIKLFLIHINSILYTISQATEFNVKKGETISLYAFDPKTKLTSSGLKYKLNNSSLMFGEKDSTSNVAASDKIKIEAKDGIAVIVRNLSEAMENGFIQ
ncbi:MAG: thiamine diphosphokinase [Ignavibacteriales bacterium]